MNETAGRISEKRLINFGLGGQAIGLPALQFLEVTGETRSERLQGVNDE
ncbi:hypothetical protein [Haladaptatus cibarius]|nr:hypothetical protein [Haladaptatus cibarius]